MTGVLGSVALDYGSAVLRFARGAKSWTVGTFCASQNRGFLGFFYLGEF